MRHTAHPTPLLEREHWRDLSGTWRFCFEDAGLWRHPSEVVFDREIEVPYAPESPLSGLDDQDFHTVVWYGLTLTLTPQERAGRVLDVVRVPVPRPRHPSQSLTPEFRATRARLDALKAMLAGNKR